MQESGISVQYRRPNSISRQLVLLLLAFAILPVLALAGLVYTLDRSVHRREIVQVQTEMANRLAQAVVLHVQGSLNSLRLLTLFFDVMNLDQPRSRQYLSNFMFDQSELTSVALTGTDGKAIVQVSRLRTYHEDEPEWFGGDPGFQMAHQGQTVIGSVQVSPSSRLPQLRLYVPVKGKREQIVGILCADVNISRMWQLVSKSYTGKDTTAYIVDKEGVVIASDDLSLPLERKNLREMDSVARFLRGVRGVSEYIGTADVRVLGTVVETPLTGWGVVVETPVESAYSPVRHIGWVLLLASLALVLFAGAFGWMFSVRNILRPILSLQHDVRIIATGDLNHRIALKRNDELGMLATDLSIMTESLRELTVSKEILSQENQERRKTEVALRENERRLTDILNFLPDATLAIDQEKRIIIWNEAIEKMTGVPSEAMLGQGDYAYTVPFYGERRSQLMDLIWNPEDNLASLYSNIRQVGRSVEAEVFCPALYGGRGAWVFLKASPLHDRKGNVIGAIESIRDITQHKQADEALQKSEERLRSLIDAAPFGAHLYELDDSDTLVFRGYNRSADRVLRLDNSQFLNRPITDAFPSLASTEIPERFKGVAKTGEPYEIAQLDFGHERIPGSFELHAFQTAPRWMAALFTDITERKRAEAEKEKLQAQLLQAQKMESVGRLAGGVAHDFNNKIQAILGYTALSLTEVQPESPVQHWLREVEKAAEQSAALTRQLLAFARKQTIRLQKLDLNETISGMMKMLQRLVGEDITLQWTGGSGLWRVKMDPAQIDQIVVNLVVNSRDAISGTGRISLETENFTMDTAFCQTHTGAVPGDYVLVTISDDGSGMSAETMANIFEPFFTTKELGKGTGLGLATVYGIVKQNSGYIDVQSGLGSGTTFRIWFPRHEGTEDGSLFDSPDDGQRRGTETVLMVEDEETIIELGRTILQRLGYRVLTASKPEEAIHLVESHRGSIDLLITDVVMPEMNGRELARRLTRVRPGMECLFMSGYTADVIAHHGVLDEGLRFIQKPFSVRELSDAVRKILEEKKTGPVV